MAQQRGQPTGWLFTVELWKRSDADGQQPRLGNPFPWHRVCPLVFLVGKSPLAPEKAPARLSAAVGPVGVTLEGKRLHFWLILAKLFVRNCAGHYIHCIATSNIINTWSPKPLVCRI